MKKTFLFSVACWLGAMNASAIDWTVATNIAKGCDVTVSSSNNSVADAITDGNSGTRWQANPDATGNDWVLVNLGESKKIADIEVLQEASYASKYDVYVLSSAPTITDGETQNTISLDGLTPTFEGVAESDFRVVKHFDTAVEGQYLLFYATEESGNATQYGTSIWEIYVSEYSADYDKVSTITLSGLDVINGETGTVTVVPYTMGGNATTSFEGVENLTLTVSDPDAANITKDEEGVYTIEALKLGSYTLTATATINGEAQAVTATLNILYNWNGVKNVALNKTAYASHNQGIAGLSIDGDLNTRWELGANIPNDTWYYVDLGGIYTISAIGQIWDRAYASHYKYYVATEKDVDGEPVWTELAEIEKTLTNAERYSDTYVLPETVDARYVKLECLQSEVWGMSFYEFMVAGETATVPVPAEVVLSTNVNTLLGGESATLSAVIKDDYANVMENEVPTLTIVEGDGQIEGNTFTATTKGIVKIQASYEGLTAATVELNVIANATDKISMAGATATADNGDASMAIDGNGGTFWVTGEGEAADAEVEHWIQVEMPYAYDLDAITLSWEGACPADYKVYAGSDADNLTAVYTEEGHVGGAGMDYTDKIATDAKGVKVIKVVTTKNATVYGIKLFEVVAYGQVVATETYTREGLTAGNYGTICLPFAATVEGATLYSVTGKNSTESYIILEEVEKAEAGYPYIFVAEGATLIATYEGVPAEAKVVNGVHGTLEAIAADNAVLVNNYMVNSNNELQKCAEGCSLAANRAYINLAEVPVVEEGAGINALLLYIENNNATSVSEAKAATGLVDVYTLSGVRVRSQVAAAEATEGLAAGIYIVNGKKYVVK